MVSALAARRVGLDFATLASFSTRHRVRRLLLYGSVLRGNFRPNSDVDILIE